MPADALEFHALRHSYDNGGRFWVGRHELHCGDPLAIKIDYSGRTGLDPRMYGKLVRGRIEYDARGWYFIGDGVAFAVHEGMEAAVPRRSRMAPLGPTW